MLIPWVRVSRSFLLLSCPHSVVLTDMVETALSSLLDLLPRSYKYWQCQNCSSGERSRNGSEILQVCRYAHRLLHLLCHVRGARQLSAQEMEAIQVYPLYHVSPTCHRFHDFTHSFPWLFVHLLLILTPPGSSGDVACLAWAL